MGIDEIFARIVSESADRREQGTRFEHAVKFFLEQDPSWLERVTQVWLWDEAPTNSGKMDTGIDLVAEDVDGSYWAVQAKCYAKPKLAAKDVSTFFMNALADERYGHYMIADTVSGYTSVLEEFMVSHPDMDLVRLDLDTMRGSNLDWEAFIDGAESADRVTYDPRPHQREAIDAVKAELADHDRCSLVMACGTGKTLTSLRLAEERVGTFSENLRRNLMSINTHRMIISGHRTKRESCWKSNVVQEKHEFFGQKLNVCARHHLNHACGHVREICVET